MARGRPELDLSPFITDRPAQGVDWRGSLLKAIQQGLQERAHRRVSRPTPWPWRSPASSSTSSNPDQVKAGIALAGSFKLSTLQDRLASLARDKPTDAAARTSAMKALAMTAPEAAVPVLGAILTDPSEPVTLRMQAAGALATGAQAGAEAALLSALPTAPERLQTSIATGPGRAALGRPRPARCRRRGQGFRARPPEHLCRVGPEPVQAPRSQGAARPLAQRAAPRRPAPPRPDRPAPQRVPDRDARPVAGCPGLREELHGLPPVPRTRRADRSQLDGIGVRGVDRLLEDILDPNRNVDQAFRTTQLALKDGQLIAGLLLREEGEVLVLADAQGKEVRIRPTRSTSAASRNSRRCPPTSPIRSPRPTSMTCWPTWRTSAPAKEERP